MPLMGEGMSMPSGVPAFYGMRGDAEEIGQANEFLPALVCRQLFGPTQQERNMAGALEKTFFLPGMMVSQMISMIRKETDQGIVSVRT